MAKRPSTIWRECNPAPGTPLPPVTIETDEDAVFCWVETCREMIVGETMSAGDLLALEMLCSTFARWRRAERECAEHGDYQTMSTGYQQITPQRSEANKASSDFMRMCARFGITPAARRMTTGSAKVDRPEEPKPKRKAAGDTARDGVVSYFRPMSEG